MTPSPYQQAIYDALRFTNKNIVVKAGPGSGKTTTIAEAAKLVPYGKKVLFVAFNRHSVADLKAKLPNTVECSTLHSMGCKAIYKAYNGVHIKENKQIKFIEPIFERVKEYREKWRKIYETDQLLSLVRATMTDFNFEAIQILGQKHAIYPDDEIIYSTITSGMRFNSYTFDESRREIEIDFSDMIGLSTQKWVRVPQYDYVFADEGQDFSRRDILLLERFLKPIKGRLIVVADDKQSVYGFRGADLDAFKYFTERPNTIQLPLTVSYRCPKAVVANAQKIYPDIEPWELAQEGVVRKKGSVEEIQNNDFVLARNLRPLVDVFLQLVSLNKKCTIVGKELEKGLLTLLQGIPDSEPISELEKYLDEYLDKVKERLSKQGIKNPSNHPKFEVVDEKVHVLKMISERCSDVGELITMITSIFQEDSVAPIKLLTIHRSKGLEADRVFYIESYEGKKLIPSQYAVTPEMLIQERNLEFVCLTRSKKELIYLDL